MTNTTTGFTWTTFTPQIYQGGNVTTTNVVSRYLQLGKLVLVLLNALAASAGTGGNIIEIRNLPVAAVAQQAIHGSFTFLDAGTQWYAGHATGLTTTSVEFHTNGATNSLGINPAVTLASSDAFYLQLSYEAA